MTLSNDEMKLVLNEVIQNFVGALSKKIDDLETAILMLRENAVVHTNDILMHHDNGNFQVGNFFGKRKRNVSCHSASIMKQRILLVISVIRPPINIF